MAETDNKWLAGAGDRGAVGAVRGGAAEVWCAGEWPSGQRLPQAAKNSRACCDHSGMTVATPMAQTKTVVNWGPAS